MTEIIKNLHMIGAAELEESADGDLLIDMGGILNRVYAYNLSTGMIDIFKSEFNTPVLSYEIDEVEDDVCWQFDDKLDYIREIVRIAISLIQKEKKVYVMCLAGQNRSGLIVGLILKGLGWRGEEVVDFIQSKRENALNNDRIREYLLIDAGEY